MCIRFKVSTLHLLYVWFAGVVLSLFWMPSLTVQGSEPRSGIATGAITNLSRELQVGVIEMPPFTMKDPQGRWEGLSVELWEITASQLGWHYRLQEFQPAALLQAIATGRIDVGISPLPLTVANEELVDFTHSYYSSGLCVAVAHREVNPWKALANEVFSRKVMVWTFCLFVILVLVGTAVWLAERKANRSQFEAEARRGIESGIWWAAVTLTTVGYGDKVPSTKIGRIIATLWLLLGVFLLAAATGQISSSLTLNQLASPIQSPQDLSKHRIAAVSESAGADYLLKHRIRSRLFPTESDALESVRSGQSVALVSATPFLRYRLRQEHYNLFNVLPFTLDREDYAFVLPNGSALREPLNRQILQSIQSSRWSELLFKYLEE